MDAPMEKRAGVLTLGCRVNQYETQACSELISSYGYRIVPLQEDCDLYFINTCSVTAESDRKCRQAIHKVLAMAEKRNAVVVLCGCHIQAHPEATIHQERVYRCGNTDKVAFVGKVLEGTALKAEIPAREQMKEFYPSRVCSSKNTRAFIKIEDGCDNFCSYCIVPHLRGPVRSRPVQEVLAEAERLSQNGYRELVLTGIETSFYGKDLPLQTDLCSLAEAVSQIPGVDRIRFGSLRPTLFTEDFTKRLSRIPKILPHFHLSIQSGSNKILAMMKRYYDRQEVFDVFDRLRRYFPDVTFSADLICGFPGETEQDFSDSAEMVRKGSLLHAHIFPYSERPGTPAAQIRCQVPVRLRKERCAKLLSLAQRVAKETILDFQEKRFSVLVEKKNGAVAYGYTENFIYTQFYCPEAAAGDLIPVVLNGIVEHKPGELVAKATVCSPTQ